MARHGGPVHAQNYVNLGAPLRRWRRNHFQKLHFLEFGCSLAALEEKPFSENALFVKVVFRVGKTILFPTPPDPADPADLADPADPADLAEMVPEPAL